MDETTQQQGTTPPDMPNDGGGNGNDNGGGSSSSSSSVTWTGATEITSGGTYSNETYTSTTANQNALLISTSANVTLNNPAVTKSGNGDSGDNSSFYGTNAGVLVKDGSTTTINGGTVTTSASGANGVFSYGGNGGQNGASGDGTTVVISDTTIKTTGDASGGIMTTGGGGTRASNLTVTTTGQSSAPIRSDRGGGTVSVTGGSYTSSGLGSPAIYSTAAITVSDATLTSNLSEGVCIEGQNSVVLNNCTLTASNTQRNGNAQFLDAVILYQSMSGDSSSGTATFTMNGGTLNNQSGHAFHVTNTNAVINLNNVTINNSGSVLLSVCDDGWSGAENVATLNASGQELTGNILVGDDSTLTLNLTNGTTFTGNVSGAITDASGSTISSSIGTVGVILDSSSIWYLTGDTYISAFSGDAANVVTNGYNLYVNNVALDGTTNLEDIGTVQSGIVTSSDGTQLSLTESLSGSVVDMRNYPAAQILDAADAPANISGGLVLIGNSNGNSILGSSGNANIMTGYLGDNILTFNSTASDEVYYSGSGNDFVTDFTPNLDGDSVFIDTTLSSVTRNDDVIVITAANGNSLLLQTGGNDNDTIYYSTVAENRKSAQIADSEETAIIYSAAVDYFALGQTGTLIVADTTDNVIALDGSAGQEFFNVANIDASYSTGNNVLKGDAQSNLIICGDDGSDTLLASKYGGDDMIMNAAASDSVWFTDSALSDIVAATAQGNLIAIAFNTGNVVTVQSKENLSAEFVTADGSAYRYNHSAQSWQSA